MNICPARCVVFLLSTRLKTDARAARRRLAFIAVTLRGDMSYEGDENKSEYGSDLHGVELRMRPERAQMSMLSTPARATILL